MLDIDKVKKIQDDAVRRYTERYDKLGVSPKSLGWGCTEHQLERFNVIINECCLEGKTVMDIGCGFADLYDFLKANNINIDYIGVDINPSFIDFCKGKHPEQQFYCANIMLDYNTLPKADVAISLGTLNFRLSELSNEEYAKEFMEKAYGKVNEKLIVDFLSSYLIDGYPREDFVYYYSPEKMLSYAFSRTNNVRMIHNYKAIPQKEFMLIMEK